MTRRPLPPTAQPPATSLPPRGTHVWRIDLDVTTLTDEDLLAMARLEEGLAEVLALA